MWALGPQNGENLFFLPFKFLGGILEYSIGHNQFQNIPRRAAKFRENRFTNVEIYVNGKRKTSGQSHLTTGRIAAARGRFNGVR